MIIKNMQLKSIREVKSLKGKRVILRADFNTPLKEIRERDKAKVIVTESTKIKETLPTLEFLIKKGAKVILLSHLGRPEGRIVAGLRLNPVAQRLIELLGNKEKTEIKPYKSIKISPKTNFTYATDLINKKAEQLIGKMKDGDIVLLENTRFYPKELVGDSEFIAKLASYGDLYVDNAFASSHRSEGTIVEITKHLPSYAGFLLEKEINALSKLIDNPKKSFVALIGGIKISTKIALMENLLTKVDHLCLGGGIANTFFKAMGYGVGDSEIEDSEIDLALKLLKIGAGKIILPADVITGDKKGNKVRIVEIKNEPFAICKKSEGIYDIGPETIGKYALLIKQAETIIWNGPFGYFEVDQYKHGSIALGRIIAARSRGTAFGVVGGGETISCLEQTGMAEFVDHISTGGGAMLTFLEGKGLPGITPLLK
jgi:phosphoglycerate kinase